MDLFNELQAKTHQLESSIKSLRTNGTAYAQAERDYKILLREEVLKLKDSDMKVTLIPLVVYGIPSVATKRYERDCAETVYKANLEAINSIKLQMRIIENQLSREWSNSNENNL